MSTTKRYSNQTEQLTPTGGHQTLKITASSSLMTNYEPARSVDAEERIKPLQDKNGDPIIFSVGTTNHLYVVLRDAQKRSGWAQYDVSGAIDPDANVAAFDAYRLPNDKFVLAVALVKNDTVRFLITQPLSNDPTADFWSNFSAQLVERPNGLQLRKVAKIKMGVSNDEDLPTILVNASKDGTNYDRYRVKADTSNSDNIWNLLPMPQNAHSTGGMNPVVDTAIGKPESLGMAGTYTLYRVGEDLQLTFDSFPFDDEPDGQIISREMTVPDGAVALDTVIADEDGNTDLYVAGNAIYRFPAAHQEENDEAVKITSEISGGDDTELAVLSDAEKVAVWFLDDGVLNYVSGDRSDTPNWSRPMPIAKNIGQIAALRNTVRMTNEIFSVSANNELTYQYQDPTTTIWQKIAVTLSDVGKAIPFQGYTTVIHFEDERDSPAMPEVKVSASSWVYATINGQQHILDVSTPISLQPDASGVLTIITRSDTASSPVISIASESFKEVIDVNPQHVVNESLKQFTQAENLYGAKTQDGQDVIPEGSKLTVEQFSGALGMLTGAADAAHGATMKLRRDASQIASHQIDIAKLREGGARSLGISGVGTAGARLHTGTAAQSLIISADSVSARGLGSISDPIKVTFGDLWNAITNELEEVGEWVLNVVDDGLQFIVKLADGVATFILDTLEKIYEALSWVLKQIKMGLDKLIKWIGQLFNWDDILTCRRVIANGVNKLLDWTVAETDQLKGQAAKGFNSLAEILTGHSLPDDIKGLSLSGAAGKKREENQDKADQSDDYHKSPAGGFAKYHISHSTGNEEMSVSEAVSQAIKDFLNTLKTTGKNISGTVKAIMRDIVDGINDDTMSLTDILKKILDDAVLGTFKTINDLIRGMLDVLADVIQVIKAILNKKIDIPFLTGFFKLITKGEDITFLNVLSLIAAVPTTVMIKLFAGKSPFEHIPTGLTDKNISPKDYMNLLTSDTKAQARGVDDTSKLTAGTLYAMIGGAVALIIRAINYGLDLGTAAAPPGSSMPKPVKVIMAVLKTVVVFMTFPLPKNDKTGFSYLTKLMPWLYGLFALSISIVFLATSNIDIKGIDEVLGLISPIVFIAFSAAAIFIEPSVNAGLGLLSGIAAGIGSYSLLFAKFFPTPKEKVLAIAVAGICLLGVKLGIDGVKEVILIKSVT